MTNTYKTGFYVGIAAIIIIVIQWLVISQIRVTEDRTPETNTNEASASAEKAELNELVNETFGYKFKYPANWNALSIQETVEVSNDSNPAKILIQSTESGNNFLIENDMNLSDEERKEVDNVLNTVKSSFEQIEKSSLTEEEIKQRYNETLKEETETNN